MNTTEKVIKLTPIQQYVLDCIDPEGYKYVINNDQDKIKFLIDTFKSEYAYPENIQRYKTTQRVFEEWLKGLPSCFGVDFYYHDIILKSKLFGFIPENASELKEESACELWWSRIFMAVHGLARKYNIPFSIN